MDHLSDEQLAEVKQASLVLPLNRRYSQFSDRICCECARERNVRFGSSSLVGAYDNGILTSTVKPWLCSMHEGAWYSGPGVDIGTAVA